ncbi:rho family-interacting cell polarization regulator 1-like [Aplochiton taeniatus]
MFTGSTKNPPPKTPQPERLDEVYAALRKGLQSYLQVHQLELDSLGQQIRESKRNGRLGFLYELDKQVKAIERFMRRLEFHLSKVEELYDAYCMQRRLRDGASKMVAAFNSATGSKEARESLSEANRGYREYTEHMCSLESELESQMGEFHIKMKGLAGFARLCAGDQYEVMMRFGRQRWRLRGRVEVSSKQIWDSEDYIFLPLITELLSIKVTELKSLANHVVVGSVSCETLDLFCPLPQTVAVDINDLGTVKLNLEVTWSPFDKDDQTSSASTVSKRFLSNQSPPDTPSMREQVFYSLLKRQGELDNGTVWSNSSESSDDSSSPAMGQLAHRIMANHSLQTTPTIQISFSPRQSSASTPSLSSNQEEDEPDTTEGLSETDFRKCVSPNGYMPGSQSLSQICDTLMDSSFTEITPIRPSETPADPDLLSHCPVVGVERPDALALPECGASLVCDSDQQRMDGLAKTSATQAGITATRAEASSMHTTGDGLRDELCTTEHYETHHSAQDLQLPEDPLTGRCHSRSYSFSQEVETALESFDFLNCTDLDNNDEEGMEEDGREGEKGDQNKDNVKDENRKMDELKDRAMEKAKKPEESRNDSAERSVVPESSFC